MEVHVHQLSSAMDENYERYNTITRTFRTTYVHELDLVPAFCNDFVRDECKMLQKLCNHIKTEGVIVNNISVIY